MRRIIGREVFDGKPVPGEYTLTLHELGNGHREAVVSDVIGWEHVATLSDVDLDHFRAKGYDDRGLSAEDHAERHLANRRRAARRATTRVRRSCKWLALDTMLTLTYRENMLDQARCKLHMREFIRRLRRLIPGFPYVAAFERQKRGAWHVHLAVQRLPLWLPWGSAVKVKSFNVIRAIWRDVTGECGGNIDASRRKRFSQRSPGKLAAYLSKYMLKAFEDGDDWSNRYTASAHTVPDGVKAVFTGTSMREMVELAYAFAADGPCEVGTFMSRFGDLFFISTEGPPG